MANHFPQKILTDSSTNPLKRKDYGSNAAARFLILWQIKAKNDRSHLILDVPSSVAKGNAISVFSENIRTLLTSSFPVDGIEGYTG